MKLLLTDGLTDRVTFAKLYVPSVREKEKRTGGGRTFSIQLFTVSG